MAKKCKHKNCTTRDKSTIGTYTLTTFRLQNYPSIRKTKEILALIQNIQTIIDWLKSLHAQFLIFCVFLVETIFPFTKTFIVVLFLYYTYFFLLPLFYPTLYHVWAIWEVSVKATWHMPNSSCSFREMKVFFRISN